MLRARIAAVDATRARLFTFEREAQTSPAVRLILCPSPNMLGELRDPSGALHLGHVTIDEHPCELTS
jgi:hypothetical protein